MKFSHTYRPLLMAGLFAWSSTQAQLSDPPAFEVGFVRNEGQVKDEHGAPAKDVLYMADVDGIRVQLRRTGFSYQVVCSPDARDRSQLEMRSFGADELVRIERIDLDLPGNGQTGALRIEEGEEMPGELNYVSDEVVGGVKHFRSVRYQGAWPGADLLFELVKDEAGKAHFKYSMIVHEGVALSSIELQLRGLTNTRVEGGTMLLEGEHFGISERIPSSWLVDASGARQFVPITYSPSEGETNTARFICDDRALSIVPVGKELVIDPTPNLQWGVYFGGVGSEDKPNLAVKKNGSGAIALSGSTTSNGIATAGVAYVMHAGGLYDAFLASFTSAGSLSWATYFGGSAQDFGYACAFDLSGSVYLAGSTNSTGLGHHGLQNVIGGGDDGFLAKFTSTGSLLWSTYYGGPQHDHVFDVATDATGAVYLAGDALSAGLHSAGAHQTTLNGGTDLFLIKFGSTGNRLWCTYYGGSLGELAPNVSTDANGYVYLAGSTSSANGNNIIATNGAHQPNVSTTPDGFLVKFSPGGVRQWGTYYGGNGYDRFNDVAVNCNNEIYAVGCTGSTNGTSIATPGAHRTTNAGNWDGFFVKFTSQGNRMYGSYYGGTGYDCLQSVSVAAPDLVYYAGWTESTAGIAIGSNLWQPVFAGIRDGYIGRFTPAGVAVYGTYFGGSDYDSVDGIECFTQGNVVFAGETRSNNGIATIGPFNGLQDAFVAEFDGPPMSDCSPAMPLAPDPPASELCELMDDGVVNDPGTGSLLINPSLCTACGINIFDLSGRRVLTAQVNNDRIVLPEELRTKPFIVQLVTGSGNTCSKVMVP